MKLLHIVAQPNSDRYNCVNLKKKASFRETFKPELLSYCGSPSKSHKRGINVGLSVLKSYWVQNPQILNLEACGERVVSDAVRPFNKCLCWSTQTFSLASKWRVIHIYLRRPSGLFLCFHTMWFFYIFYNCFGWIGEEMWSGGECSEKMLCSNIMRRKSFIQVVIVNITWGSCPLLALCKYFFLHDYEVR